MYLSLSLSLSRWRAVDNDRYAMIHARKPELKSEPTWKI